MSSSADLDIRAREYLNFFAFDYFAENLSFNFDSLLNNQTRRMHNVFQKNTWCIRHDDQWDMDGRKTCVTKPFIIRMPQLLSFVSLKHHTAKKRLFVTTYQDINLTECGDCGVYNSCQVVVTLHICSDDKNLQAVNVDFIILKYALYRSVKNVVVLLWEIFETSRSDRTVSWISFPSHSLHCSRSILPQYTSF